MGRPKPLLVVGHRNPDTDSICAAISYAKFKSTVLGEEATACRAGSINSQTRFALDTFHVDDPVFLADVLPRLQDIMIPRSDLVLVSPNEPLGAAYEIIIARRFSFMPVVDAENRCCGRVTALGLAELLGRIAGVSPGTEESAPESVRTLFSRPVTEYLEPVGPTFPATAAIRDVERDVNRYNEGGFIVTDEEGKVAGVVTRVNFMSDPRFRVALVDHNELSQSVDGIEQALVEEIIDHHRIGLERTNEPITVINRVVGSTCTIIADMYRRLRKTPEPEIAGVLLSGLLSDTVVLNSPTTTHLDREISAWLAKLAGVDAGRYGRDMFEAGSETADLRADEILARDRKHYVENGHHFAVSQIEMVGFEAFWNRADEVQSALENSRLTAELSFAALMVTDITTSTTLLVFTGPRSIRDRIVFPEPAEGVYEMKGVLSRKKQILPLLLELI